MNQNVKRYDIEGPDWDIIENSDGDWVKFEDYKTLLVLSEQQEDVINSYRKLAVDILKAP